MSAKKKKLKTETNTPEMRERIDAAFEVSPEYAAVIQADTFESFFEHGQWWVRVEVFAEDEDADPRTFSVVDAEPGIDGFDFEEV